MRILSFVKHHLSATIGILLLVVILVLEIFNIAHDFRTFPEQQFLDNPRPLWRTLRSKPPRPNPEAIAPWMTFRYLNRVFSLPQNYLKINLAITSRYYPFITLANYAKEKSIPVTEAVLQVKNAIILQAASSTLNHSVTSSAR